MECSCWVGVECGFLDTFHSWALFSVSKENSGISKPTCNSSLLDCALLLQTAVCIILATVISTYIAEPFSDSHIWS